MSGINMCTNLENHFWKKERQRYSEKVWVCTCCQKRFVYLGSVSSPESAQKAVYRRAMKVIRENAK